MGETKYEPGSGGGTSTPTPNASLTPTFVAPTNTLPVPTNTPNSVTGPTLTPIAPTATGTPAGSGTPIYQASYTYDGTGNRLMQTVNGATSSYSYNALDQLTGDGANSYTYDGR